MELLHEDRLNVFKRFYISTRFSPRLLDFMSISTHFRTHPPQVEGLDDPGVVLHLLAPRIGRGVLEQRLHCAEDVVGDTHLDFELLLVREAAAVDDAHLLDEGGLAGLAAAQEQDPVLHLALLLLILQVCGGEGIR